MAYGIGASSAVAVVRQLSKEENMFVNKYFITLVLFQALFFVPAGMVLLWNFPHWESMQLFPTHGAIPFWLILLWSITNITNAILAYIICYRLIRKGNDYGAFKQLILGYFLFFWMLVYDWDGAGWQRFFYDATINGWTWTNPNVGLWSPRSYSESLNDVIQWLAGGNVFITLLILGVFFLTPMLYYICKWGVEGIREDPEAPHIKLFETKYKSHTAMLIFALSSVLGVALGLVLLAAFVSMLFNNFFNSIFPVFGVFAPISELPNATISVNAIISMCIRIPIVIIPTYILGFRKNMIIHKLYLQFGIKHK